MRCPLGYENALNHTTKGWKKVRGVSSLGIPSAIHGNIRVGVFSKSSVRVAREPGPRPDHDCGGRECLVRGLSTEANWQKKKGQEMVDGLQAIFRKSEGSQHASPTPSTTVLASSRLPPLSIGTATLADHTDCKPGAGIARLPLCRSVHRLQPDTSLLPLAQDVYCCHQETESRF